MKLRFQGDIPLGSKNKVLLPVISRKFMKPGIAATGFMSLQNCIPNNWV